MENFSVIISYIYIFGLNFSYMFPTPGKWTSISYLFSPQSRWDEAISQLEARIFCCYFQPILIIPLTNLTRELASCEFKGIFMRTFATAVLPVDRWGIADARRIMGKTRSVTVPTESQPVPFRSHQSGGVFTQNKRDKSSKVQISGIFIFELTI